MENKQTAVKWLESEFVKLEATVGVYGIMYSLIDQAKVMEKEQIIDAHGTKTSKTTHHGIDVYEIKNGQHYYNETYGSKTES